MKEQCIIQNISDNIGFIERSDGSVISFDVINANKIKIGEKVEFSVIEIPLPDSSTSVLKAENVIFIERSINEQSQTIKLIKVAINLNTSILTIVEILAKANIHIDSNPNTKISIDLYNTLQSKIPKRILNSSRSKTFNVDDFSKEYFIKKYCPGTIIETTIIKKIPPSQIITGFVNDFIGRLSVLDISWCFPDAEKKFNSLKEREIIKCVIIDVDYENKQVKLSQKHLSKPNSDTITWERIERGDEFYGNIRESLNNSYLISTENGLFGLLNKTLISHTTNKFKIKVNSKLDYSDLLSFVPASLEIENISNENIEVKTDFNFIESDLISYDAFKKSLIGINATNKDHELIHKGFKSDNNFFNG